MKFKRNQPRSQPIVRVARLAGPALVALLHFRRTSAFVVCRRLQPGDERQNFSGECGLKRPAKGGITTESFGTEATTGLNSKKCQFTRTCRKAITTLLFCLATNLWRCHS